MCKEYLNERFVIFLIKSSTIFKGLNEFILVISPVVLIIIAFFLIYIFRNTIEGDINSISQIITLFSVSFGVLLAVNQYSLKAKAEKVEREVRLITLFSKLMDIANARGEPFVVNNGIKNAPIGVAAQDAAIAAIFTLGNKYNDILGSAAKQGLESLTFKSDVVGKYINYDDVYKNMLEDFDRNLIIRQKYLVLWMKKGQELYNQGNHLGSLIAYQQAKELSEELHGHQSADIEQGLKRAEDSLNKISK